jgi:membrane protease YdiL (CAAX protease family)
MTQKIRQVRPGQLARQPRTRGNRSSEDPRLAQRERPAWKDAITFAVLALAFSYFAWVLLRPLISPLLVRTGIAMFGPMMAAAATIRLRKQPLRKKSRMSWVATRTGLGWAAIGAAVIVVIVAGGAALSLAAGTSHILSHSQRTLFSVGIPLPAVLLFFVITAYGEESGWRGFLLPQLYALGPARLVVITAVLFTLWHTPVILLDGFDFPLHRLPGVGQMLVFALPYTAILSWLRVRSRGVAAPAGAHAAFNLGSALLSAYTSHSSSLIAAPMGLAGCLPLYAFTLWLVLSGRLWGRRVQDRAAHPGLHLGVAPEPGRPPLPSPAEAA